MSKSKRSIFEEFDLEQRRAEYRDYKNRKNNKPKSKAKRELSALKRKDPLFFEEDEDY